MLTVKCINGTEKRELFATSVVKKERKKQVCIERESVCVCLCDTAKEGKVGEKEGV